MDKNEVIIINDIEQVCLAMRNLAFAQLSANCILGLDATEKEKEKFVASFDYTDITEEDFSILTPKLVFLQYFNMFRSEDSDSKPVILYGNLLKVVNKLTYYGLIKTYSKLVDDGIMNMYCSEQGDIYFLPKGQKIKPKKKSRKNKKHD